MKTTFDEKVAIMKAAFFATVVFSTIPAWLTHVIHTIQAEQWLFLLAGAIFAPIGVIHGWGLWFGFF